MKTVRLNIELTVEEQHYHLSEMAEVLTDLANDLKELVNKHDAEIPYPVRIILTKPNSYGMNRGSANIRLLE